MCTEAENFKCVALTPWATQSQLLANTSNRFIGVISRLSNLPRDLLSAQLTLGPLRKPGLQFKSQEAAGLHFCWAVGKHADYCQEKKKKANQSQNSAEWEEPSWKAGYKGERGASAFSSCCTLGEVKSWFGFFVWLEEGKQWMGRAENQLLRVNRNSGWVPTPLSCPPRPLISYGWCFKVLYFSIKNNRLEGGGVPSG